MAILGIAVVVGVGAPTVLHLPPLSAQSVDQIELDTPSSAELPASRSLPFSPPGGRAPVVEPGNGTTLTRGARNPYSASRLGEFEAKCTLSHRATADPIVAPGNSAFRHSHDFFGNRTTDADSTLLSLRGQASSCDPGGDAAAYWVPTLLVNGMALAPESIQVYYQVRFPQNPAKVRTFPEGLRMIAGDSMAMSAQSDHIVQWSCFGTSRISATIPDCGSGLVQLLIEFPDCWDGASLDSADHKSHMAYSRGKDCPATHQVLVPQLSFRIRYAASGAGVSLSSDAMSGQQMPAGLTAHGDFINTWDPAEFDRRVATCLNTAKVCDTNGTVIR
jgi:Domain of unknown function (DUF1996)